MEGRKPKASPRLVDPKVEVERDELAGQLRAGRRERDKLTEETKGILHTAKRLIVPTRAERREKEVVEQKEALREDAEQKLLASKENLKRRNQGELLDQTVLEPLKNIRTQANRQAEGDLWEKLMFESGASDEDLHRGLHTGNLARALSQPETHEFLIPNLINLYRTLQENNRLPELRTEISDAIFSNITVSASGEDQNWMRLNYVKLFNRMLLEPAPKDKEVVRARLARIREAIEKFGPKLSPQTVFDILASGPTLTRHIFDLSPEDPLRVRFKAGLDELGYGKNTLMGLLRAGPKAAAYAMKTYDPIFLHLYGITLTELCDLRRDSQGYEEIEIGKLFDACDALERKVSGSVRKLFKDYGIREFYRYPEEMLLAQLNEEKADRPYGVIMFPYGDHNGAFDQDKKLFQKLFDEVKEDYRMKVFEVGSSRDVARQLIKLGKAYSHKISFAILGGHGSPDSISLSSFSDLTKEHLSGKGHRRTGDFFEKNATIILESCSTGKEEGVAQKLRDALGVTVIGPDMPTSMSTIKVRKEDNGALAFDVSYRRQERGVRSMRYPGTAN